MKIRLDAFPRLEPFPTKIRVAFISQERSFEKDLFSGAFNNDSDSAEKLDYFEWTDLI